jgi:hypothetical protein
MVRCGSQETGFYQILQVGEELLVGVDSVQYPKAREIKRVSEPQGRTIVGGRLSEYVAGIDELCPRIEKKFPKPKGGIELRFSSLELLAAGVVFEQNAECVAHEGLRQQLRTAGVRLIETGIART